MHGTERRTAQRLKVQLRVEMEWGSEVLQGMATAFSAAGMFVAMDNPLWMGAECSARVHLPGGPVKVNLVVSHVHPGTGVGVTFVDMPPDSQQQLVVFLEAQGNEPPVL